MRNYVTCIFIFFSLFLLTGCWNKFELTEWGFVQAVAIDMNEKGKIELSTHIYKPSGGAQAGNAKKEAAYVNIHTEGNSVFDAIRDIPIHLGRKSQWSHMRAILISEQVAKKRNVGELLDFFERDHEPRGTVYITITKGKAKEYLEIKPLIEHTMGQQLREIANTASRFSAKTTFINLYNFYIALKSETHTVAIPYVYLADSKPKTTSEAGIALLKNGKMLDEILLPDQVESYLMLVNQFKSGVINIPCDDKDSEDKDSVDNEFSESFEIGTAKTKIKINTKEDLLKVLVSIKIKGSVGELVCSAVSTAEEQDEFGQKVAEVVKKNLQSTVKLFQANKVDCIGIGNRIYRKNPALWKRWRSNWEERFAKGQFDTQVDVTVESSGMVIGKPSSQLNS